MENQQRTLDFIITMWNHFQQTLNKNEFKDPAHLEYLQDQEKYYRTLYLKETCEQDNLFTELGFDSNQTNQFRLS